MPFWDTHRTIAYEARAEAELARFTDPHDRFHDQVMGWEWLLARTPTVGKPAQKDEINKFVLLALRGDEMASTHEVWILYSYDAESVTVHALRVTDGD